MITSFNKLLACTPPAPTTTERKLVGGIAMSGHRNSLVEFSVVFGTPEIPAGSKVYVSSQMVVNQKWKDEIYELEGNKVVFVPETAVLLVDKKC